MENPDVRLVFVNDDTIPEMYVAGDYWDYYLFTQKNGVYDVVNSGYSSIKWIRKENILSMFQTKFNYEEYKIENGKFVLLQGESDNWENAESINKTVYSWEQCELMLKNIIDRS